MHPFPLAASTASYPGPETSKRERACPNCRLNRSSDRHLPAFSADLGDEPGPLPPREIGHDVGEVAFNAIPQGGHRPCQDAAQRGPHPRTEVQRHQAAHLDKQPDRGEFQQAENGPMVGHQISHDRFRHVAIVWLERHAASAKEPSAERHRRQNASRRGRESPTATSLAKHRPARRHEGSPRFRRPDVREGRRAPAPVRPARRRNRRTAGAGSGERMHDRRASRHRRRRCGAPRRQP